MKASSGGWGSQIRATTQFSVLRKRVMQKQRRLRKREIEEEEERERILNREPCGKIKPEDSEHWLMRSKNILCTGEPKRSMQSWRVRGRDAWMGCRHFHCNCLNCCSLLFQEHTLGEWQSQFRSSHRSSTQSRELWMTRKRTKQSCRWTKMPESLMTKSIFDRVSFVFSLKTCNWLVCSNVHLSFFSLCPSL